MILTINELAVAALAPAIADLRCVGNLRSSVTEELKSLSLHSPGVGRGDGREILAVKKEYEATRFANVRKKKFKRLERVRGRLISILDGLELHTGVFSTVEQRKIVDCIYDFQEKGAA